MPASLTLQESALLSALGTLLADEPAIEMDSLRVKVGALGYELGRTYLSLRSHNLVQEHQTRPGFFRRLFGAESKRLVSLTDAGRALAKANAPRAPESWPPETRQPETRATESSTPEPQTPETPAPQTPRNTAPAKPAPVTPKAPPKAAPAQTRKKPRAAPPSNTDFTETLGGAPVDHPLPAQDPVRLEGLGEMLGLTGFEITPAGQLLAGKRWSEGRRDSEVALEILVVALAHAANLDALGMAHLDRDVARQFFAEVEREFAQLAAAGELSAQELSHNLATVFAILGTPAEAKAPLANILQDPVLGSAPPAICPDDFYHATPANDATDPPTA